MKKKLYISQIGSWTHNPLPTHFSCVVFSHHLASIKFFFTVIPGSPHVIWSWPRPSLSLPNPSLGGMFSTLTLLIERPHYAKQEIRKKNKDKGLCHKYLLLVADSGLTYIQCAYLRIFKKFSVTGQHCGCLLSDLAQLLRQMSSLPQPSF